MLKQSQFLNDFSTILSNLKKVPRGDERHTLADLKHQLHQSERRVALVQLKSLCRWYDPQEGHPALNAKEFLTLLEQYWRSSPSLEFKRLTTEALLQYSSGALKKEVIQFCKNQITVLDSSAQVSDVDDLKAYISQQYDAPSVDQSLLYWAYLIGGNTTKEAIHEYLYDIPFAHPYFRLVRWLFTYSEIFRQHELFAIITSRFFDEPDGQNKAWQNGTPTAMRRRARRSFNAYLDDDHQKGMLALLAYSTHNSRTEITTSPSWPLLNQIASVKGSPRTPTTLKSTFEGLRQDIYGLDSFDFEPIGGANSFEWAKDIDGLIEAAHINTSADIHELIIRVLAHIPKRDKALYFTKVKDLAQVYFGYGVLLLDYAKSIKKYVEPSFALRIAQTVLIQNSPYSNAHYGVTGRYFDKYDEQAPLLNAPQINTHDEYQRICRRLDSPDLPRSMKHLLSQSLYSYAFRINHPDVYLVDIVTVLQDLETIPSQDILELIATRHLRRNSRNVHQSVERLLQIITKKLDEQFFPGARLVFLLSQSSSRTVKRQVSDWVKRFKMSEAPLSWFLLASIQSDQSQKQNIINATDISSFHRSLIQDVLTPHERRRHQAILTNSGYKPNPADFDDFLQNAAAAEDFLECLYLRSETDLTTHALYKYLHTRSTLRHELSTRLLGVIGRLHSQPTWLLSSVKNLNDTEYLDFVKALASSGSPKFSVKSLRLILTSLSNRSAVFEEVISILIGHTCSDLLSAALATQTPDQLFENIDLHSIIAQDSRLNLRAIRIRALLNLYQSNHPLRKKSALRLWSQILTFSRLQSLDALESETSEVQVCFSDVFGMRFMNRMSPSKADHLSAMKVLLKVGDIHKILDHHRFVSILLFSDRHLQSLIIDKLNRLDASEVTDILNRIYAHIKNSDTPEAITFGLNLLANCPAFIDTIKRNESVKSLLKILLRLKQSPYTSFALAAIKHFDLSESQQFELLCNNRFNDSNILKDLSKWILNDLFKTTDRTNTERTAIAMRLFSAAIATLKLKAKRTKEQNAQAPHFAKIFKTITWVFQESNEQDKLAKGTLLSEVKEKDWHGFMYGLISNKNDIPLIGISLFPLLPNTYYSKSNYTANLFRHCFPISSTNAHHLTTWQTVLEALSTRKQLSKLFLEGCVETFKRIPIHDARFRNSVLDAVTNGLVHFSKHYASQSSAEHYKLINRYIDQNHPILATLGLTFLKHVDFSRLDNAANLITQSIFNTNNDLCLAAIEATHNILKSNEDFGLDILEQCLQMWSANSAQYDNNYAPGTHILQMFKGLGKSTRQKLASHMDNYLSMAISLYETKGRYSYSTGIAQSLLSGMKGDYLKDNLDSFVHLLFTYQPQQNQTACDLILSIVKSNTEQENIDLLMRLTKSTGYQRGNKTPLGLLSKSHLDKVIKRAVATEHNRAFLIGLIRKERNIAECILSALSGLDPSSLVEHAFLIEFLTQAPWAHTEAHALLKVLLKGAPDFQSKWIQKAYLSLFHTTHAASVLTYSAPILMDNIDTLSELIKSTKPNMTQLGHLLQQYKRVDDADTKKQLGTLLYKILMALDLDPLIESDMSLALLCLDHDALQIRQLTVIQATRVQHVYKLLLTKHVLFRLLPKAQHTNWVHLLKHQSYQAAVQEIVNSETDLALGVIDNLFNEYNLHSEVNAYHTLARQIAGHISDKTYLPRPALLLSLAIHPEQSIQQTYQKKIKDYIDLNTEFRQSILPEIVKLSSTHLSDSHDIMITLPKTEDIESLSAHRVPHSSFPRRLRWNNIFYSNQEGFQSHPNNMGCSIEIAGKSYDRIHISTFGAVLLTDSFTYQRWDANTPAQLFESKANGLIIAPWFVPARAHSKGAVKSSIKDNCIHIDWDIQLKGRSPTSVDLPRLKFGLTLNTQTHQVQFHYNTLTRPTDIFDVYPATAAIIEAQSGNNKGVSILGQLQMMSPQRAFDPITDFPAISQPGYGPFLMRLLEDHFTDLKSMSLDTWLLCFQSSSEEFLKLVSKVAPKTERMSHTQLHTLLSIDHPRPQKWIDRVIAQTPTSSFVPIKDPILSLLNHHSPHIVERAQSILVRMATVDEAYAADILRFCLTGLYPSNRVKQHDFVLGRIEEMSSDTTENLKALLAQEFESHDSTFGERICERLDDLRETNLAVGIWFWNRYNSRTQLTKLSPTVTSKFKAYQKSIQSDFKSKMKSTKASDVAQSKWWLRALESQWTIAKLAYPHLKRLSLEDTQTTIQLTSGLLDAEKSGLSKLLANWLKDIPLGHDSQYVIPLMRAWRHPIVDIRQLAWSRIESDVVTEPTRCAVLLNAMVPSLCQRERWDGHHTEWLSALQGSIRQHTQHFTALSIWRLLKSVNLNIKLYAVSLMRRHFNPSDISIAKLIELASSDCYEIRKYVWDAYQDDKSRIQSDMGHAVKILESSWEDSRQFAFAYFGDFRSSDWTVETLIQICDSTLPDVQQFGQSLLTKFMDSSDETLVLLRLSQHPDRSVEQYVAQKIVSFCPEDLELLKKLLPYFKRVLARVNLGRKARDSILGFIATEALRTKTGAIILMPLITWLSGIHVKSDKIKTIALMTQIKDLYPTVPNPIQLSPKGSS